ncbi:GNAT family N-acetyltransferase [Stackebrandtia nassauensis]|uniref:GCN5-related N-acetyltransferase n=1 Tax=Stackebrandtia nassauensis (strain DSM 44728 / CIP 108903 / NRRL B-16338 / NBRC 102104 / LLR-40K-21) TaxID=446470 RepID=D3Q4G2_STANL|nr:GNAT family N-acetyltransferase [Stackebrandtia nassauensis]ADD40122.1 GCN5-related N-acetyltransferase [Stackebrandtia nassauensis DSM 44728]
MPNWTIKPEPIGAPDVDDVMEQYFDEMGRRVLGREATETEKRAALTADPNDKLAPPRGLFLVARDPDGEFLGCAGVRLLPADPRTAELKRMFVHPAGRGAGLGRGLLLAVEDAARTLGAKRIVCETNTKLTEARTLYTRNGYAETEPYEGHGKADHWFAKDLDRP